MDALIAFLNQNPSLASLFSAALIAVVLSLFLASRLRSVQRQLEEYRHAQKQQQHALIERITISNDNARDSIAAIHRVLETSAKSNEERLERLSAGLERRQEALQRTLDERMRNLQDSNDKRLGASFKQVSEQLERVHQGLGEMQTLATGVGDLKRVLSGVKTRGIWGELRLQTLLEQNLTPAQYLVNTTVAPGESERVEFAVKLPGKQEDAPVLLPIDSKFPQEDYHRLLDAQEKGDKALVQRAETALDQCILVEAKRISDKYIRIPYTTDFAVMFLPIEGLYAEALKRPSLSEKLQTKYRVIVAGPTTLSALLSSLQMGFRSVAVEKRSEEIWRLLGTVREDFARYGDVLERTRQRLEQASGELDNATARSRAIHRSLTLAEQLEPTHESASGEAGDPEEEQ